MKNFSKKYKRLVGVKELYYRHVITPEQWKAMLQGKYGMSQNQCSKKHKNGECWLFAESEIVFDKHGNISKSSRKLFNTQLQADFNYRNVYDVHCRLEQWNMSIEQNKDTLQFPLSLLIQPANMVFSYNEHGDLASASDGKIESTFEYKYDDNENWTTRYQIANGKCVEIIVRQLTYRQAEETVAESDMEDEIAENEKLENVNEAESEDANKADDEFEDFANVDNEETDIEDELSQEDSIEEHLETSDDIIGQKVTHTKFGVGEIIQYEDQGEKQYISVSFPIGVKRFIYPDAFEGGFLEWLIMEGKKPI